MNILPIEFEGVIFQPDVPSVVLKVVTLLLRRIE